METHPPLKAIHPACRLAALMRLSRRARRLFLEALERVTWWQRRRELINSLMGTVRRLYAELAEWIERKGRPVFAGRAYLAQVCGCKPRTVTRGIRQLVALGLIERRRRRWQDKRGRWHEASSLYSLPPTPPDGERDAAVLRGLLRAAEQATLHRVDIFGHHTSRKTKKTQNKVASGNRLDRKQPAPQEADGFVSAETILEEWAKRGIPEEALSES